MDDIVALVSKIQLGTLPGWIQVALWLAILWKGLPSVLDAWTNRLSKEADRTDREIARLESQLKASDSRHDDCLKAQDSLRKELDAVYGQLRQLRQLMQSQFNMTNTPPAMIASLAALDKLTS